MLSPLSSHIYSIAILYNSYSCVTFLDTIVNVIFIYTMTELFFVIIFCGLQIRIKYIIVYFEYTVDICHGDNFISSNFLKRRVYINIHAPIAVHQDAFNMLCIPNCVNLCVLS